jgi:hypothetical protein
LTQPSLRPNGGVVRPLIRAWDNDSMRYMYEVNELMKRPQVLRCVREPHTDGTTRVFDTEDRGAVAVFAGTPYKLIRAER